VKAHQRIDEQTAHNIWVTSVESSFKSAICIVIYTVIKRKWHRDKVIQLFNDIVDTINTPVKVFGREVDDLHIQSYIESNYPEIDFSKIKFNLSSHKESKQRNKEYGREKR